MTVGAGSDGAGALVDGCGVDSGLDGAGLEGAGVDGAGVDCAGLEGAGLDGGGVVDCGAGVEAVSDGSVSRGVGDGAGVSVLRKNGSCGRPRVRSGICRFEMGGSTTGTGSAGTTTGAAGGGATTGGATGAGGRTIGAGCWRLTCTA